MNRQMKEAISKGKQREYKKMKNQPTDTKKSYKTIALVILVPIICLVILRLAATALGIKE